MGSMRGQLTILVVLLSSLASVHCQWDPHFTQNRTTIVHLFEWRWNDIAEECERFLGPYGFGGLQVSPPNENAVRNEDGRPWYERYQPVSYKLETRSGNEQEFQSMVRRCNSAGVRVYVDAVINHMTGTFGTGVGTGGSNFDSSSLNYPEYSAPDFNGRNECPSASGDIEDFNDVNQIRNCKSQGLNDLNQGKDYVRQHISDFFNRLISYGVAGFRVDAAKHMWPGDLKLIYERLNSLPTDHGFSSGARPFIFHEVIDFGLDAVSASEYFAYGRVQEFKAAATIGSTFRRLNEQLKNVRNWGEGFMPDGNAVVFVDNHDNQRAGSEIILTYKTSRLYKMAQAFTLSWPYGVPRVMSSFYFESDSQGPPHDANDNILPVTINPDITCGNGWVCEHRWRQIFHMVQFRNIVQGTGVNSWWDNGNNQIAFSRGDRGFLAINNDDGPLNASLQTGLPSGSYCDIISGSKENGQCTGKTITVGSDGRANLQISNTDEDPMVAIHVDSRL